MKKILSFLNRHPWIYVALAFAVLIAAWTVLIMIAAEHAPRQIEIPK